MSHRSRGPKPRLRWARRRHTLTRCGPRLPEPRSTSSPGSRSIPVPSPVASVAGRADDGSPGRVEYVPLGTELVQRLPAGLPGLAVADEVVQRVAGIAELLAAA